VSAGNPGGFLARTGRVAGCTEPPVAAANRCGRLWVRYRPVSAPACCFGAAAVGSPSGGPGARTNGPGATEGPVPRGRGRPGLGGHVRPVPISPCHQGWLSVLHYANSIRARCCRHWIRVSEDGFLGLFSQEVANTDAATQRR